MKKRQIVLVLLVSISLCAFWPIKAMAGDINSAEQSVLDYCSGTFSYEGKTYRATSDAIASAAAKLSEDGTDLTENQAEAAKLQIKKNIAEGVAQGYLVEVTGQATGDGGQESGEKESGGQEGGGSENGGGNSSGGSENGGGNSSGEPGNDGGNHTSGPNSGGDGTNTSGQEGGSGGKGNGGSNNGGQGSGDGKDTAGDGTVTDQGKSNSAQNEADTTKKTIEKIDIQQLLEAALQDTKGYQLTLPSESEGDSFVTVESYREGTVLLGDKDGNLLLKGSLPVKNTGYFLGRSGRVICNLSVFILAAAWISGLILAVKLRGKRNETT